MKFASTFIAVAIAVSVSATAIPEACSVEGQSCMAIKRHAEAIATPDPWCWHPGQVCVKSKRTATAYAEAWCWHPGQVCVKVKRAAEAFAEAIASPDEILDARCESSECFDARLKIRELAGLVALTVRDATPEAYIESLNLRDETKLRRDASEHIEKREAEADAEATPWCWHPGQVCVKTKRSCGDAGSPCDKLKRAAAALANAVAEPAAEPQCLNPGQICVKERREAEATAKAWCMTVPGCNMAKRDAHALAAAANEVLAMYN